MNKLFNLRKWLTTLEAARHLSDLIENKVSEAEVLRLALDGNLKLSVRLLNGAMARPCLPRDISDIKFEETVGIGGNPLQLRKGPNRGQVFELTNGQLFEVLPTFVELQASVWNLPMIGNEIMDVERRYQLLTRGADIDGVTFLDGTFVANSQGDIYQLQEKLESMEINEPVTGLRNLKAKIRQEGQIEKIKTRGISIYKNYFPASGLPGNSPFVVLTQELRKFELSLAKEPEEKSEQLTHDYKSNKLQYLNQAALRFWGTADRNNPGTHPKNADVQAWLEEKGFSASQAEKAASIIRPEWAFTGRKPEE